MTLESILIYWMVLDIKLFYLLNNLAGSSGFFDGLVVFFAQYFPYVLGIVFLLFLLFGLQKNSMRLRVFWLVVVTAVIARLGITELIRFFYHRPRPFMALHAHQLLFSDKWSFPSGHAALLFAVAIVIYLHNKPWGVGFFAMGILITVSRIIAGIHYPTDILGGMLVGIGVGYVVFFLAKKSVVKDVITTEKLSQ